MSTAFKVEVKLNDTDNRINYGYGSIEVTCEGHEHAEVLDIGSSEVDTTISTDITGGEGSGYLYLEHTDATSTSDVSVGFATGVYVIQLEPGERALLPLLSTLTHIYMKTNSGNVDVRFKVIERSA